MSQPGECMRSTGSGTSEDQRSRCYCFARRASLDLPSEGYLFPEDNELDLGPGWGRWNCRRRGTYHKPQDVYQPDQFDPSIRCFLSKFFGILVGSDLQFSLPK